MNNIRRLHYLLVGVRSCCFVPTRCLIIIFAKSGHINLTTQRLELTGLLREYIGDHDPLELKVYDFNSILIATDNFSFTNKLGQGGFGPVYKVFYFSRINNMYSF
jgi:hypothetical protein